MSLIEKIDKMNTAPYSDEERNFCYTRAINDVRKIILSEQKEPFTIGDKIRESNDSLAKYVDKIQQIPKPPVFDTLEYILDYLNQPTTDVT